MRLFIFLLCSTVFGLTSNDVLSQNSKIEIQTDKTVSVDEVFRIISIQTDYKFIYQSDLFKNFPKIDLKKGTVKTNQLLNTILSKGRFELNSTSKNTFAIHQLSVVQQNISGIILDDAGTPLAGVTVLIKGTNKGASSDFNGAYSIEASPGDVLVFSYLGYGKQEITVDKNSTTIDITMVESASDLDQVVVVGYGKVKKRDLTGSVASVNAKDFNVQPASQSFDQMLGGQLSGVTVSQVNSRPGSGAVINIRGAASIAGLNQPLYVVDGIPIIVDERVPTNFAGNNFGNGSFLNENPLLSINPNDIETIDVLKDASASAIYGSRAANGVILITTKKGRKNQKPTLNINLSTSFQSDANPLDFMDADQYRAYITQVAQNTIDGGVGLGFDNNNANIVLNNSERNGIPYFGTGNTNWREETFRSVAINHNVGLSYSGGTEKTTYFLSLNASDQEGISVGNDFKNLSTRLNFNSYLSDKFNIGTNISFNRSVNELSGASISNSIPRFQPTFDVFNEDGSFTFISPSTIFDVYNPVALLQESNTSKSTNFTGLVFGEYEILKGLKFKTSFNTVISNANSKVYTPIEIVNIAVSPLKLNDSETLNTVWANTLSFKRSFNEVHNIDAVIGSSFENRTIEQIGFAASGFDNDALNGIGFADNIDLKYEDKQEGRLNSHFGRLNYNYDNRYYITATARADGSSKFGKNNRWGFFPSGALMWNISNEAFLKDNTTISDLRLRTSFGRTGLANLPEFQHSIAYEGTSNQYVGDNAVGTNGIPNPNLKWESTDQFDIALEFGLFNNKITGSINHYNNKTSDLILLSPISTSTGDDRQFQNVADISNTGWEIELGTNLLFGDFQWISSFNIATNTNKLDALNGGSLEQFGNPGSPTLASIREGSELGIIYGYEVEGIFQDSGEIADLNAAAPNGQYQDTDGMNVGDYKIRDTNGDGEITEDDRKKLGSIQPDFFGGWNNTFRYKGFELGLNFQFVQGLERVWGNQRLFYSNQALDLNVIPGVLDNSWSPDNRDARFEQARFDLFRSSGARTIERRDHLDVEVYDASYIRLKTLRLAYNLSNTILNKLPFESVQLNLTVNNVFTITDWPGLDPESLNQTGAPFNTSNSTTRRSFSVSSFNAGPLTRTVTLGLNVGF